MASLRSPRPARGGTIIELLVSVAIFAIALAGVFLLFRKGYQAYHFLERRQSLQVELLRVKSAMQADFELSHLRSVGVQSNVVTYEGEDVHRDDVSCLILSDWTDRNRYHSITRAPLWDQYSAYVSAGDRTVLTRRVFQSGSTFSVRPLPSLTSYAMVNSRLLTENLLSLEGALNFDTRDLVVTVELGRYLGARGVDDKRSYERYEGVFRFTPRNTQPKL